MIASSPMRHDLGRRETLSYSVALSSSATLPSDMVSRKVMFQRYELYCGVSARCATAIHAMTSLSIERRLMRDEHRVVHLQVISQQRDCLRISEV